MLERVATIAAILLFSAEALAVPKTFKYDQFHEDLTTAAVEVDGKSLAVQPGFELGEAWGQIYRPTDEEFPLKIVGFDMILAGPPNASGLQTDGIIEIYNSSSNGPQPNASPIFSISTQDLFNKQTSEFGVPLQGNYGISVDFDYDTQDAEHPPFITSGNIWIMIRYTEEATTMTTEWGTSKCEDLGILQCGCQKVAPFCDLGEVKQANVLSIYANGSCSGSPTWYWTEDIGVVGDFILRMRADVAKLPCVQDCDGKECGDDGCGGSCGTCEGQTTCNASFVCEEFCVPACSGKQCGDDGCGATCGTCGAGSTCNATGQCISDRPGQCDPPCPSDQSCVAGVCQPACTPACDGKDCGDDGCGGFCGQCSGGETCSAAGVCEDGGSTTGELSILAISPASGFNDDYTDVSITGTGFMTGASVKVGGRDLVDVSVTGSSLISGRVPPEMDPGSYAVIVVNPDDAVATLPDGYEVKVRECGNGVCSATESCTSCPVDCGPCVSNAGGTSGGCSCRTGDVDPTDVALLAAAFVLFIMIRRRKARRSA